MEQFLGCSVDLPEIWSEPLPIVTEALQNHQCHQGVRENLPDIPVIKMPVSA